MKKNIFLFYCLTLVLVFVFILAWEFWLEPIAQPLFSAVYSPESTEARWEFVKTVFSFCAAALTIPTLLALKLEKRRQAAFNSLKELQEKTSHLLDEKTIQLDSVQQELIDEKIKEKTTESIDDRSYITLGALIDSISDSIMVINNNYQVKMLNKAARDIHFDGSHPTETILCHKLSHNSDVPCSGPDHKCPFQIVMETGESCTVLHYHLDSHGNSVPFEIVASPIRNDNGEIIGIIELSRDVSSRLAREKQQKEADARLLNLQREQSIATLAGGLAHEFNNILTSILGNAELLSIRLDENDVNKNQADAIITGSEHLADLTKQLLAYAKGGKYRNQSVLIDAQIRDTLRLIYTDKFRDIDIELDLEDDLWPVLGDSAQISQLLMNIIINAFEALENKEGKILIRTANLVKAEKWECRDRITHPPGDYVFISVTNTGSTIPQELMDKIFEPFFTTKFAGRGLGLAAAKGIVQNHNGCIIVESLDDQTTFQVILPREISDQEVISGKTQADSVMNLKVLIVDDELQVLSIIRSLLDHHGCNVLSANRGKEALEIIERHRTDLDLVILDIKMPDMSGDEVYNRLKEIKPDLKVLISSGHDEYTALKNIRLDPRDKFIKKPFRMSDLILKIKELMVQD